MDQKISFRITALDADHLRPQLSRALEQRTELISRQKYPKMWELTEKLNRVEKVPNTMQEYRAKRRRMLGILNWLLGVFLLTSGLMEPQKLLIPLLVGAVGFSVGVVTLWQNRRALLGVCSLFPGVILTMGALGNPAELGTLLILGIACLDIGVAALLSKGRKKQNPFDKAAQLLLQEKSTAAGMEHVRITFSPEGMVISRADREQETHLVPYSSFEWVLETADLLLPMYHSAVTILQKKDLLTGNLSELRVLLKAQTQYFSLTV